MGRASRRAVVTAMLIAPGACMVGPDYKRPQIEMPASYQAPESVAADPMSARLDGWWNNFEDPVLSEMIHRAESGSLTLQQAVANIEAYRAGYGISFSQLFPSISVGAGYSRELVNFASQASLTANAPFNQWNYGIGVSTWEVDLFGKIRRGAQSAQAQFQGSVEQYRLTLVSLRAEVAVAYLAVRTYQAQLVVLRKEIELLEQIVKTTEAKAHAGAASMVDVAQAKAQAANAKALLPTLEASIAKQCSGLSVLLGEMPGRVAKELAPIQPIPLPTPELAVGIPADLLRRRADVLNAERQLVSAVAQIGVAEAGFYPQVSLMGDFGIDATTFAGLWDWSNKTYIAGPRITWNFFNGGLTISQVQQKQALALYSELNYRLVVLTAVSQVETALSNYAGSKASMHEYNAELKETRTAFDLAIAKYKAGTYNLTQLLQFGQILLDAENGYAQSEGLTAQNLVELYRSLGGGWETQPLPASAQGAFPPGETVPTGKDLPWPHSPPPQPTTESEKDSKSNSSQG